MDREDLIGLIREGINGDGGAWADLGSGAGAFTLALAELLPTGAAIYSMDKDPEALSEQRRGFQALFPDRVVHFMTGDFTRNPDLPPLDGALMANSLHYVRDVQRFLSFLAGRLRPGGKLIVVEYNIHSPSPWVPYPLPYSRWEKEARAAGLVHTRLLASRPSRYNREIYSAASERT